MDCQEALTLLTDKFGPTIGESLLWEATSFPLDGKEALRQAKALVAASPAELDALTREP